MDDNTLSRSGEPDFQIGDWWIRPQRNLLERGETQVKVEARSMAVLVCLSSRAPEVVSKRRLLRQVWGEGTAVGEEVLSHAIWELRRAFGDSARAPTYLETIPRKGYRLRKAATALATHSPLEPCAGLAMGPYRLEEEIGRGGMGVVFRATDERLGREVAVKFISATRTRDPEAVRRFESEARLAASLDHPNLATVLEIGETPDGQRYLVTPLYRGGSLKARIAEGPIAVGDALGWTRQLVAGLGAAHQRGIVHRDIKPANLLLDEHGILKIADFGIAILIGSSGNNVAAGLAPGTPAYQSPEHTRGSEVDYRSDLWSAGVVLYELLTRRRPFEADSSAGISRAIQSEAPLGLAKERDSLLPAPYRAVLAKALAKNPEDRFQIARAFAVALEELTAKDATPNWRVWRALIAYLAGAAAAVIVGLMGNFLILPEPSGLTTGESAREELSGGNDPPELPLGTPPTPITVAIPTPLIPSPLENQSDWAQGQVAWLRGDDLNNLVGVEKLFKKAAAGDEAWGEAGALLAFFKAEREAFLVGADLRPLFPKNLRIIRAEIDFARELDWRSPFIELTRARLALLEGNFVEAEDAARLAMALEPTCSLPRSCDFAYVLLGETLAKLGRFREADQVLGQCRDTNVGGGSIRCTLKLAEIYRWQGQQDKAADLYLQVLRSEPKQFTALKDLGALYLERREFDSAVKIFQKLFEETSSAQAAEGLARAYFGLRQWKGALEMFQVAERGFAEVDVYMPDIAEGVADIYTFLGQRKNAVVWYGLALDRYDRRLATPSPARAGYPRRRADCLEKLRRTQSQASRDFSRPDPTPTGVVATRKPR